MITTIEMRELEADAVRRGASVLDLMERAGEAVASAIRKRTPAGKRVLVLAYHGNNGGDGMAAARRLMGDYPVKIWFLGEVQKLTREAREQHRRLPASAFAQDPRLSEYSVLVDALLGTGARGGLHEPLLSVAHRYNSAKAFRVAVDIPTGLSADEERLPATYFHPDLVVTFHDLKTCLKPLARRTIIADIGLGGSA